MPDQGGAGLPRIALVFGVESVASHLREAVQGHVAIAYASSAADYDAARMGDAGVVAALVNLDGDDWLEAVEASLDSAGIPVVYNDPEISQGLEGWPRARWLRHLLAKLRGSTDVDPPRPEPAGPPARDRSVAVEPERSAPARGAAMAERPLSPQEIENMTADFVQETRLVQVGEAAPQPTVVVVGEPADTGTPTESVAAQRPDQGGGDDLDVDTESLSAMIDARLADAESRPPPDSPEVWRLVEGGPASGTQAPAAADPGLQAASDGSAAATPTTAEGAPDDADVLASLPSLDDWQLVDAEADAVPVPAAARGSENAGPVLTESIAGLELVPMEVVSAVSHTDPIERWLHESEPRKASGKSDDGAKAGSGEGNA